MEPVRDVKVRWLADIGLLGADEAVALAVVLAAWIGIAAGVWLASLTRGWVLEVLLWAS